MALAVGFNKPSATRLAGPPKIDQGKQNPRVNGLMSVRLDAADNAD